ncbi:MAG: winged helix-turn-helix domain-containing protein, partial [Rhodanobacteraceae bacterium]|nr:winged helix-turn-helix domain-containing protein [Rhodanobacteraceae bacterium]
MQYRFGSFQVNPGARLLQRESVQLNVSRKVFDCLVYLIEHRDRALGRDELARALWKHDSVSDNQLAQVVAAVRRLVDDDGTQQQLVRTVPGFGYHWIGAVQACDAGAA